MEWTAEHRQLISKLLAKNLLPTVIAAQLGVSEAALRNAVRRYRLGEDLRGTRLFTTPAARLEGGGRPLGAARQPVR